MNKAYAVSDLHGQYNLWRQIIESLDETDTLYVLGDCSDRGPDGWKIIKEALVDKRVIYIRGNHDQMMLDAWRYEWCGEDLYLWMINGGQSTYDALICDPDHEIYLKELARTKLYHCYESNNGKIIHLSHAGFTLMENDEIPNKDDLLWDRGHCEDSCDWWLETNPNDYIVHGHTPVRSNIFKKLLYTFADKYEINDTATVIRYAHGHKICIDAGSFACNKIAILDLDTFEERIFYEG